MGVIPMAPGEAGTTGGAGAGVNSCAKPAIPDLSEATSPGMSVNAVDRTRVRLFAKAETRSRSWLPSGLIKYSPGTALGSCTTTAMFELWSTLSPTRNSVVSCWDSESGCTEDDSSSILEADNEETTNSRPISSLESRASRYHVPFSCFLNPSAASAGSPPGAPTRKRWSSHPPFVPSTIRHDPPSGDDLTRSKTSNRTRQTRW
mmetsp:Transcript_98731/g.264000  ORF Transcript_98731/g.264000 Transcript_98731/m.264000 type:complete len:204 (+) Transcript_98731:1996-2607(+)